MIKRILLSWLLWVMAGIVVLYAQSTGSLKGTITDEKGENVPFVNIMLKLNDSLVTGVTSDVDGAYLIANIIPGIYYVEFSSIGLETLQKPNIKIEGGKITFLSVVLKNGVLELKEFVIRDDKVVLNEKPGVKKVEEHHFKRESVMNTPSLPNTDITLVSTGVLSRNGTASNFSGSRQSATVYIDGVKIRGGGGEHPPVDNGTVVPNTQVNGTESYTDVVENTFASPLREPLSTFSVDVDKASYSNIKRMIEEGNVPVKSAIRLEEMINYFKYDYPQPAGEHPFSITTESATCPWDTNHQLVLVGLQGKTYAADELPPSNLVFLIDVSGSMSDANKLPLVKSSLRALVNQLRPQDKVAMVVYAGAAGLVLPSTKGDHKDDILAALDNLSAGGSTAGGAGILLAYDVAEKNLIKKGNNRIILCTDGDFNVGVSDNKSLEDLIVAQRDKGIYLTVLGYGMGNYQDDKMEILADKGNGNYAYINSQLEADKILVNEMSGTLYTIAKDVKIQVEFNPYIVKSYRLIGYENRLLQDWEFNDDTRDAGEIGAGHSVTALYEVEYWSQPVAGEVNDSLKYQSKTVTDAYANEMLTVKFRYKQPGNEQSILLTQVQPAQYKTFAAASENLRFASCVAAFGMILRGSAYKGTATLDMVIENAKKCKAFDEEGDRAEFIRLVKATKSLVIASK